MSPGRLRAVEPLPPPSWRFDIEKMKELAQPAHRAGVRYHGLILAYQYGDGTEEPDELKTARMLSELGVLELNNTYNGLIGTYIGIVTHSELVPEEFNNRVQLTLAHRPHSVPGSFAGFEVVDVHGLCLATGEVGEERYFPLADIEDIEERLF